MVVGLVAAKRVTFATLEKALEMGGDTNIVAAMVGALLGATKGQSAIDNRRVEIVFRSDYVRQVGEEFGQALVQHLNLLPICL
jgi:ADP-ribosylglycohydrolase